MCRSIITADSSSAVGLAMLLPAMSGALPCTASNTPMSPPRLAAPTTPSPPTSPAHRSETMSPYRFGSTQHVELLRVHAPAACTPRRRCVRRRRCRCTRGATRRMHSRNSPSLSFMMLALWIAVTFLRPCRRACSNAKCGDPRRRALGDDLQALDDARHDFVLEAGVEILGVLAHDDQVDALKPRRRRPAGSRPAAGSRTDRAPCAARR